MRKRIYVAGAINADNCDDVFDNLRKGTRNSLDVLLNEYFSPFNPFLGFMYRLVATDEEVEGLRKKGVFYDADLAWLEVADAVLVTPGSENSIGVTLEIEFADRNHIPVFYSLDELTKWTDGE